MARTRLGSRGSFSGQVIEKITGTETIGNGDSGKVFMLDAAGGAYTITFPTTLKAGVNYEFIVQEHTPTGAITMAFGSAIGFGKLAEGEVDTGDDAPGSSGATGISNLICGTSAHKGDRVKIVCDGTNWFFHGLVMADGAWTTS